MGFTQNELDLSNVVAWAINDGWEYVDTPPNEDQWKNYVRIGRANKLFWRHARAPCGTNFKQYLHILRGKSSHYKACNYKLIYDAGMWGAWKERKPPK